MAWSIQIDKKARNELLKLDVTIQHRIVKFLRQKLSIRSNPREIGESLQGELNGFWKYRVGDYRLICTINDKELIVLVIAIGHRNKIYR